MSTDGTIKRAAALIRDAGTVIVTAGAGMGVDSGLPDFRGPEGFWRAYPPYRELGLSFQDLACPDTFRRDPELAWGFYGHRRNLYARTVPHAGYTFLAGLQASKTVVAVTSNVDGAFQKAEFEHVYEAHGSIHRLQCLHHSTCPGWANEGESIEQARRFAGRRDVRLWPWPWDDEPIEVDEVTMRASGPFPTCPACGGMARPNILMFGDSDWDGREAARQDLMVEEVMTRSSHPTIVLEFGAGLAISTIRRYSERAAQDFYCPLIRINPRDGQVPGPHDISIPLGALDALMGIKVAMEGLSNG